MRRLAVKCKRCGKEWKENGFHVNHESEKIRTCPHLTGEAKAA